MSGFISEARRGANPVLIRICVIAAIGGLLFGYDTGVISGALLFIKVDLHASTFEQQAIVSAVLLGAMVGAVASGWLADHISRKWTKVLAGCVYVIGALGCACSVTAPMLIGFRFVLGLSVGTASFVAPLYISEVAPPRLRGGLVSFNQLAITTGILTSYLVNFAFQHVAGNWRWMLGLAALPGALLAVGMLTVPHTPRWLMRDGREDEARDTLELLREDDPDADIDKELDEIREADENEGDARVRDLASSTLRPILVVGLALAIFQQFVGINTVIYYAPTILTQTGLSTGSSLAATILVGVVNLAFTIVAVLLLDRVGRRALLLTGTVGLTIGLLILAAYFTSATLQQHGSYLALVGLLVFIASFAVGLGPVFWLMISEIFPVGVRSSAMAVCTVANWAANFLVAQTFLTLGGAITTQGVFYLYAGLAVLALAFFAWRVPETKHRSLEEIQSDLVSDPDASAGRS